MPRLRSTQGPRHAARPRKPNATRTTAQPPRKEQRSGEGRGSLRRTDTGQPSFPVLNEERSEGPGGVRHAGRDQGQAGCPLALLGGIQGTPTNAYARQVRKGLRFTGRPVRGAAAILCRAGVQSKGIDVLSAAEPSVSFAGLK